MPVVLQPLPLFVASPTKQTFLEKQGKLSSALHFSEEVSSDRWNACWPRACGSCVTQVRGRRWL